MSSFQIPITWRVCLFTTYIDHYILELTKQLAVCSFRFRAKSMQKFKICQSLWICDGTQKLLDLSDPNPDVFRNSPQEMRQ